MNLFSINSPLWNFTNKLLHFLWLSILWAVCCVPIITIGASTTALYTVTLKYAKKEECYITASFFCALKQNLKQASVIWLILGCAGIALGIDLIIYSRSTQTGPIPMLLMVVFFSLLVAFVFTNMYVFPVLAKFDNSTFRTMLNALVMSIRHWPYSISMLMVASVVFIVGFLIFPPLLFVSPALIAYVNSYFFGKIFGIYIVHANSMS